METTTKVQPSPYYFKTHNLMQTSITNHYPIFTAKQVAKLDLEDQNRTVQCSKNRIKS